MLCTIFGRSKSPPTSANAAPDAPPETQPQDQANQRWVLASFVLSFASFAAVFFGTGFRLDPTFFDGLRYLLPLAPVPALLLLWAGSRTNRPLCWALALLVGGTHLIGTANFFRSEVFPAPWESLTGSEPIVMRTWLRETLRPDSIAESRWPRWARWQGVSDARRRVSEFHRRMNNGEPEPLMAPPSPTAFQGEMLAEYWRGQGLGSLLETLEQGAALTAPTDHRQQERSWFWEGLGLGTAYVGCSSELRAQLLELAWSPPERHALWYGFGRADLYCRSCWQLADARGKTEPRSCCHGEEGTDSCQLGYKDAWRLDYGSGYRYSWTQVIPLDRHRIY